MDKFLNFLFLFAGYLLLIDPMLFSICV